MRRSKFKTFRERQKRKQQGSEDEAGEEEAKGSDAGDGSAAEGGADATPRRRRKRRDADEGGSIHSSDSSDSDTNLKGGDLSEGEAGGAGAGAAPRRYGRNKWVQPAKPARVFNIGAPDIFCGSNVAASYDDKSRRYVYSTEPLPGPLFGGRRMQLCCPVPGGDPGEYASLPWPCGSVPLGESADLRMGAGSRFALQVGDGKGVRVLERAEDIAADGLFSPPRPPMPRSAERRFEARVVRERKAIAASKSPDSSKLRESGSRRRRRGGEPDAMEAEGDAHDSGDEIDRRVTVLGDPFTVRQTRLDAGDDIADEALELAAEKLETEILRPVTGGEVRDAAPVRLDVQMGSIYFDDHPLFCKEDYIASGIRVMYEEYIRRLRAGVVAHYAERLVGLLAPESSDAPPMEETIAARTSRCENALEALSQQHSEASFIAMLTRRIYTKWQQLKQERVESKMTSTDLKLTVRRVTKDEDATAHGHGDVSSRHVKHARKLLNKVKEDDPDAQFIEDGEALLDALERRSSRPKEYLLRLSDEETLTGDAEVPVEERKRRSLVRSAQIYCRLLVNDKVVGRTQRAPLQFPSYSIAADTTWTLHLVRRPTKIAVEVYQYGMVWDTHLASVNVPVPGADAEGVFSSAFGPSVGLYQFTSGSPMREWQFQRPAAEPVDRSTFKVVPARDRYTTGTVSVSVLWGGGGHLAGKPGATGGAALLPERGGGMREGRLLKVGTDDQDEVPEFAKEVDFVETVLKPALKMDPNDPRNASIVRMKDWVSISEARGDRFRVESTNADLAFNRGLEPRAAQRRHRLFQLRRARPDLLGNEMIPLTEGDIRQNETLKQLLAEGADEEEDDEEFEEGLQASAAEAAKAARQRHMKDFFKRVRDNNAALFAKRRAVVFSDFVKEGPLPDIKGLDLSKILKLFEPRRALGHKELQRVAQTPGDKDRVYVLVMVGGCRNVPVRRSEDDDVVADDRDFRRVASRRTRGGAGGLDSSQGTVSPRVSVRFGQFEKHTDTASGSTPTWNEELKLRLKPPQGSFKAEVLSQITTDLIITLEDEVTTEVVPDRRFPDRKTLVRETRYLGSLSIPFSVIYNTGTIEGTVRLTTPPASLGYRYEQLGHAAALAEEHAGATGDMAAAALINEANETYMSLKVTLQPLLAKLPDPADTTPPKGEKRWVLGHCRRFEQAHSKHYVRVLATDMDGKSVLLNRYLRPQNPPPDPTEGDISLEWLEGGSDQPPMDTIDKVARFVSLIPFIEDRMQVSGAEDMWCTSQEFLGLGAGDWEEHAILLANYFQWIEEHHPSKDGAWSTYLCTGNAIVEGESVYVVRMHQRSGSVVLWNAADGIAYNAKDERCPLVRVGMLANSKNCWANVQKMAEPWKISWAIGNPKMWAPLWTSSTPMPSEMVPFEDRQTGLLVYQPTSPTFVDELENEINTMLRDQFRKWHKGITRTNHQAMNHFKDLLAGMEAEYMNRHEEGDLARTQRDALKKTLRGHTVHGFPLNMPFRDIDSVLRAVKNSGVHNVDSDKATFAHVCRVFAYPNSILSVWVYVAAFIPES